MLRRKLFSGDGACLINTLLQWGEIVAFEVKHWGAHWKYDKHRGYNDYVLTPEDGLLKAVYFFVSFVCFCKSRSETPIKRRAIYNSGLMPTSYYTAQQRL